MTESTEWPENVSILCAEDSCNKVIPVTATDDFRCDDHKLLLTEPVSYIWGSDEGIQAVVDKVHRSGEPYMLGLNPHDFEAVVYSMRDTININNKDAYVNTCRDILSGIAESVGVDWV